MMLIIQPVSNHAEMEPIYRCCSVIPVHLSVKNVLVIALFVPYAH